MTPRLAIGCMSGTSLDAIDVAAVHATGHALELHAHPLGHVSLPIPDAVLADLRRLCEGGALTAREIAECRRDFGRAHADAISLLLEERPELGRPTLIAIHGQTVHHHPPTSWQLIDPWPVADRFLCPVVSDLRGADLAVGGQGAPITPLADWVLFRSPTHARAIVNLGGFCNVTILPAGATRDEVDGFDVCACNQLLDAGARRVLGRPYDDGGAAASRGDPDPDASHELADLLRAQAESGRSLGTGDEAGAWLDAWADRLAGDDLLATIASTIGRIISERLSLDAPAGFEIYLAGGGVRNDALARAILDARPLDDLGVLPQARESVAMAVLALLAADAVPVTLPRVTGRAAQVPLSGAWINARPSL
ncbi:MAG: anhydro-N-acetylmuramic acid kinase [Phycisphaerales bacterium]